MTKQRENKSSKKNYSFTGHRIIGDNKSNYVDENASHSVTSEGNTSDDMKKILETDNAPNTGMMSNMNNYNQFANLLGAQQMGMNMDMGMTNPNPNQMQMMGNPNQMQMMTNPNQMQMMGNPNQMQMMGNNSNSINLGGDVDPTMVNTLVPLSSRDMNTMGNMSGLMNANQMAQSLGSIANLSKLNNVQSFGNDMLNSEMMMNEQLPMMTNQLNQNSMMGNNMTGNNMMDNNMMDNNMMGNNMTGNNMMGNNALKNLAALNSIKKI